jgi:hypothetical protein
MCECNSCGDYYLGCPDPYCTNDECPACRDAREDRENEPDEDDPLAREYGPLRRMAR